MLHLTFDTSVIIAYTFAELPDTFLLSAVVIAELEASASDDSIRKDLEAIRRAHEKDNTLIIPTSEDWLLASRVLYWLTQGRKKRASGKTPPRKPGASQRMMLDALIAVSARRVGATVITNDYDDYKAIQYYCNVRLQRGSGYFGRGRSTSDQ